MGKRIITVLALALLLTAMPVQATTRLTADGHYSNAFQAERKAKRIKLKKYSCGGTVLYCDTAISKKRRATMRKWILKLPKKIRKKAKRIYFVRKKYYMLTGKGLKQSAGYTLLPAREVWLYNVSDTDDLRDTLYHEYGHCWDWHGTKFTLSTTTEWERIWVTWYGAEGDPIEYYAMAFAEYMGLIQDPDWAYIIKTLQSK